MNSPKLRSVRLTAFKSFRQAVLPIDDITVLTGRNSSGKSNALDGIEVLARLLGGESLSEALDGRRRASGPIRGGSAGCAPHGFDHFQLGCTVVDGDDSFDLDVTVQVSPELRVTRERLVGPAPMLRSRNVELRPLIDTVPGQSSATGIWAELHNGKRGQNPSFPFRDSRLVCSQVAAKLGDDEPAKAILRATDGVTAALRGVFHLDPVPHLMRDYVPERDIELRRTAENLSAALAAMRRNDPDTFQRITELVRQVADEGIREITITRSDLGDVMIALAEQHDSGSGAKREVTPAREMSDGLLRFMAVATALLTSNRGLDIDSGGDGDALSSGVLIVIEEIENGLHPSQAKRVLRLIQDTSAELGTSVLVTTHSPALLDALEGVLNEHVVVCHRAPETGYSQLTRLTDLAGYAAAMAGGSLGAIVTTGKLATPEKVQSDYGEFAAILGIE